mgnify:FL=1
MTINYSIPPLSDADAFRWIAGGKYHLDTWCNSSDYYGNCRCLNQFIAVLAGTPGLHEEPGLPSKKWEDMSEAEQGMALSMQLWATKIDRDLKKASIFDRMMLRLIEPD